MKMSSWKRRDWIQTLAAAVPMAMLRRSARRSPDDTPSAGRERLLFDFGWRFHLGHADDPAHDFGFGDQAAFAKAGTLFRPSRADFNDSDWTAVDLPHDWAVELPFVNEPSLVSTGCKPLGRAHPDTSIGWYRRVFDVPAQDNGRRLALEFDGVFRDAIVALNGQYLGRNLSGYAPFRFDVTDLVNYGGRNVLVVRADATEHEGWFYEGAGIYRHVWLLKTDPVHVAPWGIVVRTSGHGELADVSVTAQLVNESDTDRRVHLVTTIAKPGADIAATLRSEPVTIPAWSGLEIIRRGTVQRPDAWSPESPTLYQASVAIMEGSVERDRAETLFGIRDIHFDPDRGFLLNGERIELKGTCNHQDHAGLGSALPDRIQAFRVETMKAMGCNAWRTSHNPPTPELLDACDRLGMLVLDETRMFSPEEEGLSQLGRMIRRDRNHPCVFAWSIGNEEWAVQGNERGARIAQAMRRYVRTLDPTRPATAAMDSGYARGRGTTLGLDVQGFNYTREDQDAFHREHPALPCMATETASAFATRGIYMTDRDRGYISAYDDNKPDYGATAEEFWTYTAARRWLAGGFVWTGFDYRGEPSPYAWPCISSHFGIVDTCGFPKDTFYYYQAWWSGQPVLHLFPHWNWPGKEGQDIDVWCHGNAEQVELQLNGRSLGTKPMPVNGHLAWKVPYEPGRLEVRGTKAGQPPLTDVRETAGAPARIVLEPWQGSVQADGEDVTIVRARIVDADGRLVPTADNPVAFSVSGPGRIIGVGNGDPSSHEADKAQARRAFGGLCMTIVQATKEAGEIRVEASSDSLTGATAVIGAERARFRPAVP